MDRTQCGSIGDLGLREMETPPGHSLPDSKSLSDIQDRGSAD